MERRRFIKTRFGTMEWISTPPPPPLTELQRIARHSNGGH